MSYVRGAYELVLSAEQRACVNLDQEIEAFVVHSVARFWENQDLPTETIAIALMQAMNQEGEAKKNELQRVAEKSMLIDGFEWRKSRWPTPVYYLEMSQMALEFRAMCGRPPETYYNRIAEHMPLISRVLHNIQQ